MEPCGIESGLLADIERFFLELAPADRPGCTTTCTCPGRLGLGIYQAGWLVDLDGPRYREVLLQLSGVQPRERAG